MLARRRFCFEIEFWAIRARYGNPDSERSARKKVRGRGFLITTLMSELWIRALASCFSFSSSGSLRSRFQRKFYMSSPYILCSLAPLTPFAHAGAAHGGGKRCTHSGCSKSAVGGSNLCTSHGGGKRCAVQGCNKSAQSSTNHCVKHGGGKKCARAGCTKVARGRTLYCAAHGGGVRCKLEGCNRVAIGKNQLCRTHGGGLNTGRRGKK